MTNFKESPIYAYLKYVLFHKWNKLSKKVFEYIEENREKPFTGWENRIYCKIKKINGIDIYDKQRFIEMADDDNVTYCSNPKSVKVLRFLIATHGQDARQWFLNLFFENTDRPAIQQALSNMLSWFDPKEILPEGRIIAEYCFKQSDIELFDNALKAFDQWLLKDSLELLEGVNCLNTYFREYQMEVIDNIKKHHNLT